MERLAGIGWRLDGYDEVRRVLADDRLSAKTPQRMFEMFGLRAPALERAMHSWFLYQDAPDHTRLRRLVQGAFSPKVIARWEPTITSRAQDLARGLEAGTEVDLMTAYCVPFTSYGIGRLLGLHPDRDADMAAASAALLAGIGSPSPETFDAAENALVRIDEATAVALADGAQHGLLHELAASEGEALRPDEFGPMAALLLAAGQETTRDLLANGLVIALDDRRLWNAIVAGEADVAAVVEEVVRLEPSVGAAARVAPEAMVVEGEDVAPGEVLWLDLRAAGRDPGVTTDPDAVHLDGGRRPVVSFGHGVHHCLGAALARRELRIGIEALAAAHPGARLAVPAAELSFRPNAIYRGRTNVPVRL